MDPEPEPLVDFAQVPRRLQTAVAVAAALALLGCVIDGAINGLTFALMGRWGGIFVLLALGFGAAVTTAHALGGADRAGQRGERLAGPDVGLSPRRFEGGPLTPDGLLHKADALSGTTEDSDAAPSPTAATAGDAPAGLEETAKLEPVRPDHQDDNGPDA